MKQNYIAGRICDHSQHEVPEIMGKDGPSNWAMVPAITTGSEGLEGSENFIQKMQDAVKQNGWVMFLTHGFRSKNNGSATYSPTYIADIDGALQWAKENDSDIWVASFRSTAMYVKERIASKVNKKSNDANSITFEVTHNIKDNVSDYDYPLTIKIKNANNRTNVKAAQSGADIETNIVGDDILVDAVPNAGDVIVYDADAITLPSSSSVAESSAGTQTSSSSVAESSSANAPKSSASTPKSSASSKSSSSTTAIASINYEATVAVFNENGYITVRDAQGLSITVFNSLGHKVRETRGLGCEQKVYSGAKGMYIVKVGSRIFKTELH